MPFTVAQVNSWRTELAAMPAPDPITRTVGKRAALEMMVKELQALARRGYTTTELLEVLAEKGLRIHQETLRAVLRTHRVSHATRQTARQRSEGDTSTTPPPSPDRPTPSQSPGFGQEGKGRADAEDDREPTASDSEASQVHSSEGVELDPAVELGAETAPSAGTAPAPIDPGTVSSNEILPASDRENSPALHGITPAAAQEAPLTRPPAAPPEASGGPDRGKSGGRESSAGSAADDGRVNREVLPPLKRQAAREQPSGPRPTALEKIDLRARAERRGTFTPRIDSDEL